MCYRHREKDYIKIAVMIIDTRPTTKTLIRAILFLSTSPIRETRMEGVHPKGKVLEEVNKAKRQM